jgi:hypothetical protein
MHSCIFEKKSNNPRRFKLSQCLLLGLPYSLVIKTCMGVFTKKRTYFLYNIFHRHDVGSFALLQNSVQIYNYIRHAQSTFNDKESHNKMNYSYLVS